MGIFSGSRMLHPDFSMLGTDPHSHVLPGMDDGSPSLGESVTMLQGLADAGYRRIITTPHVNSALYPNTKEQILGQLYHLREVIAGRKLPGVAMEVLSMGMSHDFEVAIAEGSTCGRVGAAIFGERAKT